MATPFIGEIRMFGGNFAPTNWALCNGQLLGIAQNQALFTLIGTTFGGNGVSTFQLPNLQGRLAVGQGTGPGLSNRVIGQMSGEENVTLTQSTIPNHGHALMASTANASTANIGSTVLPGVVASPGHFYAVNDGTSPPPLAGTLPAGSVGVTGGNLPHSNLMPTLCLTFIIALYGVYPSRN
jgi:microcystin-dependent protein